LPSGLLHSRPAGSAPTDRRSSHFPLQQPYAGLWSVRRARAASRAATASRDGRSLAERREMAGRAGTASGRPLPSWWSPPAGCRDRPDLPAWDHVDPWDVVRVRPPGSLVRGRPPGSLVRAWPPGEPSYELSRSRQTERVAGSCRRRGDWTALCTAQPAQGRLIGWMVHKVEWRSRLCARPGQPEPGAMVEQCTKADASRGTANPFNPPRCTDRWNPPASKPASGGTSGGTRSRPRGQSRHGVGVPRACRGGKSASRDGTSPRVSGSWG
jgi:hypothetical protein